MNRTPAAALALLAGTPLLGGCGPLSRSDYVDRVESACTSAVRDQRALDRERVARDLPRARTAKRAEEIQDDLVATLRDLEPPSALAGKHDVLLGALTDDDADSASRAVAVLVRLQEAYAGVGATRCAQQTAEQVEAARDAS